MNPKSRWSGVGSPLLSSPGVKSRSLFSVAGTRSAASSAAYFDSDSVFLAVDETVTLLHLYLQ